MGTFIKTFILTLIICFGYLIYVFIGKESYSPTLTLNEETINQTVATKQHEKLPSKVKICMIDSNNKPIIVKREANENSLEYALKELMKGSTRTERLQGAYTEIPVGTKLLSFKDDGAKIAINLSKEFEGGGGAQSVQARLLQLVRTVNLYKENLPVYLYVEGKKVEYLGGEGIYVEQPLNEASFGF
ncbi:MAG: GerMN domain-containing protein [Candidatus Gastranaerophilales bacterium]|nr:GerMN domain-containing protein [Candidatus Gastranaerophilales bacterium]